MSGQVRIAYAAVSAAALLAIVTASKAHADAVADFYKGKAITIQVGYGAGGGYDTNSRMFARHFGKYVPGNPTIIVQNVPGAGSMKVANQIWTVAPKDGTMLGVFASSTALEPLFGNDKAVYDPRKFAWIGSLHQDIASCGVWKGAGQGIKSIPDLVKAGKEVVFGSTSPTAITSQHPLFMKHVVGAKVKVVYGYKGTKGVSLAMQRGEVDGSCGMFESSVRSAYDQHVKAGEFKIIAQFGSGRKVPYFGDATPLWEMMKTDDDRKVFNVIFRQTELARPLAAPPGTPQDRVAALRTAMLATLKDKDLVGEASKAGFAFNPLSGAEATKLFDDWYATPKPLLDRARKITQPDQK